MWTSNRNILLLAKVSEKNTEKDNVDQMTQVIFTVKTTERAHQQKREFTQNIVWYK